MNTNLGLVILGHVLLLATPKATAGPIDCRTDMAACRDFIKELLEIQKDIYKKEGLSSLRNDPVNSTTVTSDAVSQKELARNQLFIDSLITEPSTMYVTTLTKALSGDRPPHGGGSSNEISELIEEGGEVKREWNLFLHRSLKLPIAITNFLGFLPIRVPGMPYYIDPGTPDEAGYIPVNPMFFT